MSTQSEVHNPPNKYCWQWVRKTFQIFLGPVQSHLPNTSHQLKAHLVVFPCRRVLLAKRMNEHRHSPNCSNKSPQVRPDNKLSVKQDDQLFPSTFTSLFLSWKRCKYSYRIRFHQNLRNISKPSGLLRFFRGPEGASFGSQSKHFLIEKSCSVPIPPSRCWPHQGKPSIAKLHFYHPPPRK